MIRNYFKIAWRNLLKSKLYSAINIVGLTIGLTVGIFVLVWIRDELRYNAFDGREQTIYRINSHINTGNGEDVWQTTPGPAAFHAKKDIPGVRNTARVMETWQYSIFTSNGAVFTAENMVYTDPSLFALFGVHFLQGNAGTAFPDDQSVVITESVAKKYFGSAPAIGKVIEADHKDRFTVRGVIADFPENSDLQMKMLFPLSIFAHRYDNGGSKYWKSLDSDWGNFNFTTYVELEGRANAANIGSRLSLINKKNDPNAKSNDVKQAYSLQRISDLNLYRPDGSASGIETVRIFGIVAALILLIAGINYVNLSTARSMIRAREVSIRKIIGAQRKQLIIQFLVESALCFMIASALSLVLIAALMPAFNTLAGKSIRFSLFDAEIWQVIAATVGLTLLLSSVYPAVMLSSFRPLLALKGKIAGEIGTATFRKVLVTVQFAFSVGLIIATIVISRQLNYVQSKNPGYDRSQVFRVNMSDEMQKHIPAIKSELLKEKSIRGVALADNNLVNIGNTTGDTDWEGKDPNRSFIINAMRIDEQFMPMMKMKFADGTNFTGSKADSTHFILNETAVRLAGIKNPVGKRFKLWETEGTIIGVVKDFNFFSMKHAIEPCVLAYYPEAWRLHIKTGGRDAAKAVAALEKIWKRYSGDYPFNYTFLDEEYNKLYRADLRTGKLITLFSGFAVFISCLGLFGLATYTAQVRTREIGIRKVLGASALRIASLLSGGFLQLVAIAIVIASPLAWWAMNAWLSNFAYKINIPVWIFLLAGGSAVLIAFFTISFQAVKAALANPVKSLRSE
ncbi:MAG: ABC transporter permease [Mucilaginibacter polytrichastri]|nr:ABC transporter permease [Mucilaginibacter polytrichastri]